MPIGSQVRSLAQRSSAAASDTVLLLEEFIQKSGDGRKTVNRVADSIRALTADSSKVKGLVDELNLGSAEQAKA